MDAWLGVKGSRVQIPPSRPESSRSEGVSEILRDPFSIFGSQTGSHSLCGFGGLRLLARLGPLLEDLVHGRGAGGERGPDLVPVDGLGDRGSAVAHQVADVLDADAVGAEDGH